MSVTIEQAFKQVLEAAIHQVKYKRFEREENHDPVEAFIEDLFAVLFPQQQAAEAVQTVTVPTVAATVTVAAAPEPAPEKPKRGRKPKAAPAPVPETEAAPAPEQTNEAPKKRGRKPKAAAAAEPEDQPQPQTKNLDKLTATNKKHIKKWADEVGVAEPDTKALLAYVNAMSAEEFNAATFEQHVKSFLQPKQEEAKEGDELEEVPFNGKIYWVNRETERVYEQRGEAYVAVGTVGMVAFADMKI